MNIKKVFSIILLSSMTMIKAQSTWYFGNLGGVKFNSNVISNAPNTAINTDEGCAGTVDQNNNVIMYTDGRYVWNGNHVLQTTLNSGWSTQQFNGLKSSTHAALICPIPGTNSTKFFIFTTTDGVTSMNGTSGGYGPLRVSIATITGSAPNTVITISATEKNIELSPNGIKIGEKISIIDDGSCGYWIAVHGIGTYGGGNAYGYNTNYPLGNTSGENNFYSYHVTSSSNTIVNLKNTQIISTFNTNPHRAWGYSYLYFDGENYNTQTFSPSHLTTCVGQMKFNPQGTKLTCAVGNSYQFQIYDFNKTTGQFSNQVAVGGFGVSGPKLLCGNGMPYGVEYSPNGDYVYISTNFINNGYNGVYQYLVSGANAFNPSLILNSGKVLDLVQNQASPYGGMQIGPDGKLYIARALSWNGLYVYNTPNVQIPYSQTLQSHLSSVGISGTSKLGLPTVIKVNPDPTLAPSISITNTIVCSGNPISVIGSTSGNVSSTNYAWALDECDVNNNVINGGFSIPLNWYPGNPNNFSFPNSSNIPCNKYYRVTLAVQNLPCIPWVVTSKVIYVACNPNPSIELSGANICLGSSQTLCSDYIPSSINSTYWGMPKSLNKQCITVTPSAPGQYPYTLTVTNLNTGCSGQATAIVNVLDNNPDFSLGGDLVPGSPTTYTCHATPASQTATLNPNFGYSWIVEEINPSSGNVVANTTVTNPQCWWFGLGTNEFSGYNGTNNFTCGSPSVGQFLTNHKYRVTRGTWITGVCNWTQISKTIQLCTSCKSSDGNPVFIVENDYTAPDYSYLINNQATNSIKNNATLNVFPNPSNGIININIKNAIDKSYKLEVFDIYGKLVYTNELFNMTGAEFNADINLTNLNLSNGLYLINVNSENQKSSQRIVIEK